MFGVRDGGDPQAADDEVVGGGRRLVGHEGSSLLGDRGRLARGGDRGGGGGRLRRPRRCEVGERHRIEGAGDRITDADPQHVDGAARTAIARGRVLRVIRGADHRGDGAFEGPKDLAHRDVCGSRRQLVAAMRTTGAGDEARFAEVDDELLEIRAREVLLRGDLGETGRTGAVVASELDHQPDAVLALRAEGDGAGPVIGRPRERRDGQGWVLEETTISAISE